MEEPACRSSWAEAVEVQLRDGYIGFHVALDMCHVWRVVFCFDDVRWIRTVGLILREGVLVGPAEESLVSRCRVLSGTLMMASFSP